MTVLVPDLHARAAGLARPADRRRDHPPARARHPPGHRAASAARAGPASPAPGRSSRSAPADYDLGAAGDRRHLRRSRRPTPPVAGDASPVPAIAFTATVPPGAEDMDPFLAATEPHASPPPLDGLPDAAEARRRLHPDPHHHRRRPAGDAAAAARRPAARPPPGSAPTRASRSSPTAPPATRTEAVAYVIEAPGSYVLPALALDWWNTADARAARPPPPIPITIDVPAPPGWHAPPRPAARDPPLAGSPLASSLPASSSPSLVLRRRRPAPAVRSRALPRLRRAIRDATARDDPPAPRRLAGRASPPARRPSPPRSTPRSTPSTAAAYGPPGEPTRPRPAPRPPRRRRRHARRRRPRPGAAPLPPLNPTPAFPGAST